MVGTHFRPRGGHQNNQLCSLVPAGTAANHAICVTQCKLDTTQTRIESESIGNLDVPGRKYCWKAR